MIKQKEKADCEKQLILIAQKRKYAIQENQKLERTLENQGLIVANLKDEIKDLEAGVKQLEDVKKELEKANLY